jgi:hypothetical protein
MDKRSITPYWISGGICTENYGYNLISCIINNIHIHHLCINSQLLLVNNGITYCFIELPYLDLHKPYVSAQMLPLVQVIGFSLLVQEAVWKLPFQAGRFNIMRIVVMQIHVSPVRVSDSASRRFARPLSAHLSH